MIVQSLWIGQMTNMEIMCIKSFLKHQHEFHLYTYEPIENIPDGTIVLDANEIMPSSEVFQLKDQYLPFSDIWRYKLLYKKGGIWVDMDMVCVSNMIDIIDTPFIFSSERTIQKGAYKLEAEYVANIGFLKAPIGSAFYKQLIEKCESIQVKGKNKDKIRYMRVLRDMIKKWGYETYVWQPKYFCPVDWWYAKDLFYSNPSNFKEKYGVPWNQHQFLDCITIHLWRNLATHKYRLDLNGSYPNESLYTLLSNLFLK
jgi:hypothetical protein